MGWNVFIMKQAVNTVGVVFFFKQRLEYEKNLEEKASLQDDYDNLQEVTKFETDQLKQQLEDRQQETEAMKTELCVRKSS